MLDNHLVAGTAGGVITALLLHPLDLIKVRLQVQDGRVVATRYTGIVSAVRTIASQEGLRGFYRGAVPGAWGSGASWGLYFYFYERAKRRMLPAADKHAPLPATATPPSDTSSSHGGAPVASGPGRPPPPPAKLSVAQHLYAAWEGGTITVFFTNPLWLVKTRMQLQTTTSGNISGAMPAASAAATTASAAGSGGAHAHAPLRPYSGMLHALATIVREEGPRGLYRGLLPALLLVSHGMVQVRAREMRRRGR
jgi:solute carrier family 25 (mitochondrial folate transporter), member 32